MPPFSEILVALAMVLGTFFIVVASIGLLRFPDVYCRMHAAGKAGTLGIVMVLIATMISFMPQEPSVLVRGVLAIFFQFLTIPAGTHLLARASYISDYPLTDRTEVDELKTFLLSRSDEAYGEE